MCSHGRTDFDEKIREMRLTGPISEELAYLAVSEPARLLVRSLKYTLREPANAR
jgi:hypothetical protein